METGVDVSVMESTSVVVLSKGASGASLVKPFSTVVFSERVAGMMIDANRSGLLFAIVRLCDGEGSAYNSRHDVGRGM